MTERPSTAQENRRAYTSGTINRAFNEFLGLHALDRKLLRRYHNALMQGSAEFAKVFYDYLLAAPATAKVLEEYQARGGSIDDLVAKQIQHIFGFLAGDLGDEYAATMAHIGEVHARYGIEPVWIMGAYLLYLDHLRDLIHGAPDIKAADRHALLDAVIKLLFRDMGLMLEGYWDSNVRALTAEKDKVAALQAQITSLLANIPQLLWSVDVIHNVPLYVSPTAREICDMEVEMPIPCLGWTLPEDQELVRGAWRRALAGERVEVESRVRQPDGSQRWFRRVFYPFLDAAGGVVRIDGLMEDTTHAKEMVERLQALATTDNLTGLPNRALLHDRPTQALAAAARDGGRRAALMIMDLNHFKEINDTLGHRAGDAILATVAHRLGRALRESDTLARLGGDEFAVLVPDAKDGRAGVEKVVHKITRCFDAPFLYEDNELYVGASIGIVISPDHGADVDTLMSRADVAMYGAKHKELGYLYYDPTLDPHAQTHLQLSADLRHALDLEEFELYYQPKIDLRHKQVIGAEALIRWRHPERGIVPPDEFIPLAERSGLIRPITDWVIETALARCRAWRRAGRDLRVAVNVPARIFQDPSFVDRVAGLLRVNAEPAPALEIEITENALMSDIENISRVLERLTALGVRIAIDDFGTGYSSLTYLKKLPLHTLKIDKSFVLDMTRDEDDATIVRSTIDLAHNLGYHVVAEGVETAETWELLAALRCDGAQGYYISRPLPADEFDRWLAASPWTGD